MKHKVAVFISSWFMMAMSLCVRAQSGVYVKAEDFKMHKLSYEMNCKVGGNKILVNDALGNKPYITVVRDGKKEELKKSEIFGFSDCDSNVYRFFQNTKYKIEEPGHIYIYTRNERDAQSKVFKLVKVYYFSVAADREILTLSLNNLKRAYASNEKFIDQLDAVFSTAEVSAFDDFHKTYKVNHVYAASLKR